MWHRVGLDKGGHISECVWLRVGMAQSGCGSVGVAQSRHGFGREFCKLEFLENVSLREIPQTINLLIIKK